VKIELGLKGFENKETMSQQSCTSSSKGLAFYAKTCQEKRSLKCKQVKKNMEQIRVLMESTDNVNSVQSQLGKCIKCYDTHESFLN